MTARITFALLAALALTRAWKPWPYSADAEPSPAGAVALHPRATTLRSAYALDLERHGNVAEAERQLLEAARNDHQYAPAWQLADFYFRHDRKPKFLTWAHLAAERSYGDLSALFRLCDVIGIAPDQIASQVLMKPTIERNYVAWLLEAYRLTDIAPIAKLLAARNGPEDRAMLLAYTDALIGKGESRAASESWQLFEPFDGLVFNSNFVRQPLARGFDWRPIAMAGVRQFLSNTLDPSRHGWTIEFSGRQPELCDLLTQYVVLKPGHTYSLSVDSEMPATAAKSFVLRIGDIELPASSTKATFRATRQLDQIILRYRRMPGQTRFQGRIEIHKLALASFEGR